MSEIKVGDMVMVVRVCCERAIKESVRMGLPWTVISLEPLRGCCPSCVFNGPDFFARRNNLSSGWNGTPATWLKRIPPLSELESEKYEEEIKA